MFNNFFILIGGIFLSLIEFFKNLSLPDHSKKSKSGQIDLSIFEKLNFEVEPQLAKHETRLDEIRDELLYYLLKKYVVGLLFAVLVLLAFLTSWEISGMYLTLVLMIYMSLLYYPQIKEQRGYSDLNQELPYALRHMSIELKAGRGLHDSLITIRNANYGSLSREFNRVLEEIKFGKSTEDSLMEMSRRVKSEGLTRAIHQIIGTLRVGGNLASSLEIIAKDISFDMQIKLKEYAQKLNSFILIYTFVAILAPVISLIMLMAGSTVMGDIISSELLFVIYTIFFPLVVMFMGLFIKKLEPQI
ncbi:MAG: type II secretion system F family protein [Methanobrevibacter sp.]|uniref:type II secretion system F family protein n=1 Tax=Methanobrevibacter sp. TaxID=66852 RepID=UPI0025D4C21E|nr:type II secretion system F family protein [Methanobrevibacter sp.]MBQ8017782.1 type II secretion system F family protein [Methanobrevibacter sp.]